MKILVRAAVVCLVLGSLETLPSLSAQSLIAGDIAGTVADPSHAVIPNAVVSLKGSETGSEQHTTTNAVGFFRFTLLKPGLYEVSTNAPGFAPVTVPVKVEVGQTTLANIDLTLTVIAENVDVSAYLTPVIVADPSINSSFSQTEVQQLPNAGGDITNIAQTSPGAVMNSSRGSGNFTINGLPATSNLFTTNGENTMDPYVNVNASGATNLTLGSNEVQEATVVANPYSGEYGQLSGAQITYVTKSGTNQFHGNVQYWWNGRTLNANDWMNNNSGTPRPFANANQWAASVGGPIVKNRTFFFVDTEGLRFVLPNVIPTTIPTPAFASAVLANVSTLQPAEYSTYQKMFQLFANAPGASNAQTIPNSDACNGLDLPGFDPTTQSCAERFQATPTALASEWIVAVRIDHKLDNNDNLFGRFKLDHGTQPTLLDAISPNFNAISEQPSWDVQLNEVHIFGPRVTNSFVAAGSHYDALFTQSQPLAYNTFPYQFISTGTVAFGGANLFGFNDLTDFPSGRNITQYQFIDDLTVSRGKHSLKFGGNFRRYDVSDHNFTFNYPGTYFGYIDTGLQLFSEGLAYQYRQADNIASNVPIAMWGLGVYAMDEWNVKSNLKLTLALRAERNSNPVCQTNCFANFVGNWNTLPSYTSPNPGDVPYTQDIATNLHQAYPGVDAIDLSPRIGFAWSPERSGGKTVISGGFGLFYDSPPAGLVDDLLSNPPVSVTIRVRPDGGTPAFDPGPNGSAATYHASAAAFSAGFNSGQTYTQISNELANMGVVFEAPAFTSIAGTVHAPRWQEWNLQLQQQLTNSTALVLNYVGNHGIRIPYSNSWLNAYDPYELYNGLVPLNAAVPNYGEVTQIQSGAVSNYNGLTVSLRRNFSHWVSAHANYTWGHNLDELSNGGIFPYSTSTNAVQLAQNIPTSLRAGNYGNSDYDIRNSFNADFVVNPSYHFGNKFLDAALGGWEWSGKIFWRSGLPFSVIDGNWNGAISNGGGTVFAQPIEGLAGSAPGQLSCGKGAASASGAATPCLDANAFVNSAADDFAGYTQFSTQMRNQYRGPHFFDMDMALFKTFKLTERVTFGVGAQAFNAFNHPNFFLPDANLGDSTFGQISTMTPTPTSPYGSFLGFDSSPRVVQISGKIVF